MLPVAELCCAKCEARSIQVAILEARQYASALGKGPYISISSNYQ
jgi:hypothetical protein